MSGKGHGSGSGGGHGGGGHGGGGAERWLLTYADLITLLMVFFIVMYAMSEVDKEKYRQVAASLAQVFSGGSGVVGSGETAPPPPPPGGQAPAADELVGIGQQLYTQFAHDGRFTVRVAERGLVLSLAGSAAFDSGSAAIKPEYAPLLEAVAERIRTIPNDISLEGFTDDDPIATAEFRSNWDLSVARANNVRSFLEERGVGRERMIVVGYGETRPAFSNRTADGKARNRRVDIVILRHRQVIDMGQEINSPRK